MALVGIGSPAIRDGANWHAFYGSEERRSQRRHVAGDICSRFYDINGGLVDQYERKTLSIEMAKLRRLAIPSASPWERNTLAFLAHCTDAIIVW